MNLDVYDSLSAEHQEIIMKAARAAGETMRDGAQKANEDAIALMAANGITVTNPERDAFAARAEEVHDKFSVFIGPKVLSAVKAAQE